MFLQHRASPLPYATQIRLPAKLSAFVSYRNWVPVFEAHIGPFKIEEELIWIKVSCSADPISERLRWWGFIDAIIDEMSMLS